MSIKNGGTSDSQALPDPRSTNWVARLAQLSDLLTLCPTDILARCELAGLLELLEQHEEALFNWKAVLACDPNNLKAREGLVRCRQQTGRPLHSRL